MLTAEYVLSPGDMLKLESAKRFYLQNYTQNEKQSNELSGTNKDIPPLFDSIEHISSYGVANLTTVRYHYRLFQKLAQKCCYVAIFFWQVKCLLKHKSKLGQSHCLVNNVIDLYKKLSPRLMK